jgi:hypothetical protein
MILFFPELGWGKAMGLISSFSFSVSPFVGNKTLGVLLRIYARAISAFYKSKGKEMGIQNP